MSRYIDADAYAAEMKQRQDALKEEMDHAEAMENWEMYYGMSRAFSVFVEAKLTLDAMPTVDAVPVVRCRECKNWDTEYSSGRKSLGNYRCVCHEWSNEEDGFYRYTAEDDYCSYGERRTE